MTGPGNAQHCRGPDALVVRGYSAREFLNCGGIAKLDPIPSLGPADLFFAELPPNLRGLRLSHFSFLEVDFDHVAHLSVAPVVSSLVADDEHDMRSFRGSRNSFRPRENSSEREKVSE